MRGRRFRPPTDFFTASGASERIFRPFGAAGPPGGGPPYYTDISAMLLSRRRFFFGSLALPALTRAAKPAGERPNIALILADGLPAWILGCYGGKEVRTPHIDHLAQTGVRFQRHFTAAPAVEPGRASLLTGGTGMQVGTAPLANPAASPLATM